MLVCECEHPRKEHLGGTLFIANRKVEKCSHESCNCKHYHSDEKSRKHENDVIFAAFFAPFVITGAFLGVAVLLAFSAGLVLDNYTITKDSPYKTVYLNGTDIPASLKVDHKESLIELIQGMIAVPLGYGGFVVAAFYGGYRYEIRRKELIAE